MPILLGNSLSLEKFDYAKIQSDLVIKENLELFSANKIEAQTALKCLYVGQREYATVKFNDPFIDIIGSDDATTCHIVLIVDENNSNCSMCHFDGSDLKDGINSMIKSLTNIKVEDTNGNVNNSYSLYIIGGFDDDKKSSLELTVGLFDIFIKCKEVFNLKLCQVTKMNDVIKNGIHYPIAYGVGYDIKRKKIFMCNKFLNKGPDYQVRSARHFTKNHNMNIYDTNQHKLTIGPFHYDTFDYLEFCLTLPDNKLLKHFSTSPNQEPPEFVSNLKESFKMMINHPNPYKTYFRNGIANIYTKQDDGSWKLDN